LIREFEGNQEGMMTGVKSRARANTVGIVLLAAALCVSFFLMTGKAVALDVESVLPEVLREAPSVEMYGTANGIVLLRDIKYNLLADGSMEKTTYLVLEEIHGLSKTWPSILLVAPPGGYCEIIEAQLYDPRTTAPMLSIKPRESLLENGKTTEIRIPNNLGGRLLVIGYRTVLPTNMNMEDKIELAMELPIWEQKISVEVPGGTRLISHGGGLEPTLQKTGPTDTYTWMILDTRPAKTLGLLSEPSKVLVFSLREGLRTAFEEAMAEMPVPSETPVPKEVERLLAGGPSTGTGESVLRFFSENEFVSKILPADYVRSAGDIPEEGPWSVREACFLLKSWLEKAGWKVEVLWEPAAGLGKMVPGTKKLWARPVLFLDPPVGKGFYYKVGQSTPPGTLDPSLWGKTLYGKDQNSVVERVIPAGEAGDHRLTLRWNIELDENGIALGDLRIRARGGWLEMFPVGRVPTQQNDFGFLGDIKFPNMPDISWQKAQVKTTNNGFDLDISFRASMGIISTGDILVRWPVAILPWQSDVLSENGKAGLSLRFPFVFEQQVILRLPYGFDAVALPATRPYGFTGISLTEEMKYNKRKRNVEGGYKVVLSSSATDGEGFRNLQSVIRRNLAWADMTIPLRKTH